MSDIPRVVVLMGPTASGKTALACRLMDQRSDIRLISVDSALVYRGMDIGTAKPTWAEQQRYPHDLIDIVEPDELFSVGQFIVQAQQAIETAHQKGQLPVLVGGTMLYFRALLEGMSQVPETDPLIRQRVEEEYKNLGLDALYQQLQTADPALANRLLPTDRQRITRALEVYYQTGLPLSQWQMQMQPAPLAPYDVRCFGLLPDRAWLHDRIAQRLKQMWQQGFLDEVKRLRQRPWLTAAHASMRAVGYRQAWQHLDGEINEATMHDTALYATRQLAKRQYTWLRALQRIHPIQMFTTSENAALVL